MKVLVTGADGFIGKNLCVALSEHSAIDILEFTRNSSENDLTDYVQEADFIVHLAGVNRPVHDSEFKLDNADLTRKICSAVKNKFYEKSQRTPIIFTSSTQAGNGTKYGISKRSSEDAMFELLDNYDLDVFVYRLSNVFGKWAKPNYNSVVATFCHNIAHGMDIEVKDPAANLTLLYIDDVVAEFVGVILASRTEDIERGFRVIDQTYETTVGEIAEIVNGFRSNRESLLVSEVGNGLLRALYSTYLSYLPSSSFSYTITSHEDNRGKFSEVLKTPNCGQFSYFTALPGITRGGHYHHTKVEKFFVAKGSALFRFRHILTDEQYELIVHEADDRVVETIPGWSHDVTNIGEELLVCFLWANEIFDPTSPDTIASHL